jgi:uncharacterized phage-associated protein
VSEERTYSVKALANWILDFAERRNARVSNMALNKLVFFAYEHALRNAGRKLASAKIEAWEHGPVYREVYNSFKKFGAEPITDRATRYNTRTNLVEKVAVDIALQDEKLIIEAIESLMHLPAHVLRELSHDSGGAWAQVWNHAGQVIPGMEITDEIILKSSPTVSIH